MPDLPVVGTAPAHAAEAVGEKTQTGLTGLKNALTKKYGPAPLWVYLAVGGVAAVFLFSRKGGLVEPTGIYPSQDMGGGGGGGEPPDSKDPLSGILSPLNDALPALANALAPLSASTFPTDSGFPEPVGFGSGGSKPFLIVDVWPTPPDPIKATAPIAQKPSDGGVTTITTEPVTGQVGGWPTTGVPSAGGGGVLDPGITDAPWVDLGYQGPIAPTVPIESGSVTSPVLDPGYTTPTVSPYVPTPPAPTEAGLLPVLDPGIVNGPAYRSGPEPLPVATGSGSGSALAS